MYITVQYEHSRRATESWEPLGSFSTNAGSREVIPSYSLSVMVLLSVHPVIFTGRNTGSRRLRCLSPRLDPWLWFVVEEEGAGRDKKTEMVSYWRFLRKIELEAFVVQMKIAISFLLGPWGSECSRE